MSHDWIWDFVINLNPRILLIAILKDLEDMNYYLFWFEVRRLECTTEWSALPQCVSAHSDFLRWQIKCQSVLFSNAHLCIAPQCCAQRYIVGYLQYGFLKYEAKILEYKRLSWQTSTKTRLNTKKLLKSAYRFLKLLLNFSRSVFSCET